MGLILSFGGDFWNLVFLRVYYNIWWDAGLKNVGRKIIGGGGNKRVILRLEISDFRLQISNSKTMKNTEKTTIYELCN